MGHKTTLPAEKQVCVSIKNYFFRGILFVFWLKSSLETVCVALKLLNI